MTVAWGESFYKSASSSSAATVRHQGLVRTETKVFPFPNVSTAAECYRVKLVTHKYRFKSGKIDPRSKIRCIKDSK